MDGLFKLNHQVLVLRGFAEIFPVTKKKKFKASSSESWMRRSFHQSKASKKDKGVCAIVNSTRRPDESSAGSTEPALFPKPIRVSSEPFSAQTGQYRP